MPIEGAKVVATSTEVELKKALISLQNLNEGDILQHKIEFQDLKKILDRKGEGTHTCTPSTGSYHLGIQANSVKIVGATQPNHLLLMTENGTVIVLKMEVDALKIIRRFSCTQTAPFVATAARDEWVFALEKSGNLRTTT